MYFLMSKGYQAGIGALERKGNFELDRNRVDFQEQLIREWQELGMVNTHILIDEDQWKSPYFRQALNDYLNLSKKYGMRVSVRFGGLEGKAWRLNPENPDNAISDYIQWQKDVAQLCLGKVELYTVGDEINSSAYKELWTPEIYMKVFKEMSSAIKSVDPEVKICMFSTGGIEWPYVKKLFDLGYAEYGDAVAANFRDYPQPILDEFVKRVKQEQPNFKIWSNGLHWVGTRDTPPYPASDMDPAWIFANNYGQALIIAQRTFKVFEAGWDCAPYYLSVRKWVLPNGDTAPVWYGYYGFMDLVLDEYGNMTIKRYPAWYAYQTIANTFYSKSKTKHAEFEITLSEEVDYRRCYVRNDYECIIIMWNDPAYIEKTSKPEDKPEKTGQIEATGSKNDITIPEEKIPDMTKPGRQVKTTITIPTEKYKYPVKVSLFNCNQWSDLKYSIDENGHLIINDVNVGQEPVIIRMFADR
jgi:hypothetical protein